MMVGKGLLDDGYVAVDFSPGDGMMGGAAVFQNRGGRDPVIRGLVNGGYLLPGCGSGLRCLLPLSDRLLPFCRFPCRRLSLRPGYFHFLDDLTHHFPDIRFVDVEASRGDDRVHQCSESPQEEEDRGDDERIGGLSRHTVQLRGKERPQLPAEDSPAFAHDRPGIMEPEGCDRDTENRH